MSGFGAALQNPPERAQRILVGSAHRTDHEQTPAPCPTWQAPLMHMSKDSV